MENFPQLRLGAGLDGAVAQVQAGSRAKVGGEEGRGGVRRAVVQVVLRSHRRRRRIRRQLVREGEARVWVVTLEAVVERGGLRAQRGGVVRRLQAVRMAVALKVCGRRCGTWVPKAGVVVQVGQAVVEVEVGSRRRVVVEAGEAGVVTH